MAPDDQKPRVQLHEAVDMVSTTNGIDAGSHKQQVAGVQHHGPPPGQANPLAIGFAAFSLCSAIFGLYNSGLITDIPQVAVGVSVGFGGLGQLYASIACFIQGETYPATTFLTYAGFFFAFGIMFSTPSGFVEAATAGGSIDPLNKCMGLLQLAFTICTFFYWLGALRQPYMIQLLFILVLLTFLFGTIGAFTGVTGLTVAAGWFSFALAVVGWVSTILLG